MSMRRWMRILTALLVTVPFAALIAVTTVTAGPAAPAKAEANGVGLTPAMGWSSWSFIRHDPTEADIEAQALAMHDSGLQSVTMGPGQAAVVPAGAWHRAVIALHARLLFVTPTPARTEISAVTPAEGDPDGRTLPPENSRRLETGNVGRIR